MESVEKKELKVIVFRLGSEQYGVDVDQVQSIERVGQPTRVPYTAPFVKGVLNLRGLVIPVVDLRSRFGLPEAEDTDANRMIVVTTRGMDIGLVVDAASDVIDIDVDSIEPPPAIVGGIQADYLNGVAKLDQELLIVVNLDRMFSEEEVQQMSTGVR